MNAARQRNFRWYRLQSRAQHIIWKRRYEHVTLMIPLRRAIDPGLNGCVRLSLIIPLRSKCRGWRFDSGTDASKDRN